MKFFAGWAVLMCSTLIQFVHAQVENTKLFQVTGPLAPEVSIAINPRNPLSVVVAAAPDHIFYSEDGGISWKKTTIKSTLGFYGSPTVACSGKGTFYFVHSSDASGKGIENESCMESLVCHISSDGGKTWEEGIPFAAEPTKDQANPFATVDGKGNVWVSWTQYDRYASTDSTCHSVVRASTSSNGKKWSTPVVLSQVHGKCANDDNTTAGSTMAVGEEKRVFANWANQQLIFLDRSFDNGGMWLTNDIIVAHQNGGWEQKITGHAQANGMPTLVIDRSKTDQKGMLYLTWSDSRSGETDPDIWFIRSNNYGDIWTPPLKVNGGTDKRAQYLPAMYVDNITNTIYIVYYDRRNHDDDQTDVYLAYSRDAGTTFKNVKVSKDPFTPAGSRFSGRNLSLVAHQGIVIPVWTRVDGDQISVMSARVTSEILP